MKRLGAILGAAVFLAAGAAGGGGGDHGRLSAAPGKTPSYLDYVRAQMLVEEGKLAQAAAEFEKVIAADPEAAAPWRDLAATRLKMGDTDGAVKTADEIARRFDDKETVKFLASIYFYAFSYKQAAYYYEKVVEQDPDDEEALTFLANYYYASKPDDALKYLGRLAGKNPDDPNVFVKLAGIYEKLKNYDSAIKHYRKSMELEPEYKEIHLALSRIYEVLQDTRSAINEYDAYLAADPGNTAVLSYLGALYFAAGELDKAKETFERLVEISTENTSARIWLGAVAAEENDLDGAIASFEAAARQTPTAQIYQYIAELQIRRKDLAAAANAAEKAASLAPDDPKVLFMAALVAMDRSDYRRALKFLDGALSIKPDFEDALFHKGVCLDNRKNFDAMKKTFERLIETNPKHHQAKNYLAYSLAERGAGLDYAEKLVKDALALAPESAAYVDTLGWIYYKKGNFAAAEETLARAADMHRDWEIIRHLAAAREALGKKREALSAYLVSLYYAPPAAARRGIEGKIKKLSAGEDAREIFSDLIRQISAARPVVEKAAAGFSAATPLGGIFGKIEYRAKDTVILEAGNGFFKLLAEISGRDVRILPFEPEGLEREYLTEILSTLRKIFGGEFYEEMSNSAIIRVAGSRAFLEKDGRRYVVSSLDGDLFSVEWSGGRWEFGEYRFVRGTKIPMHINLRVRGQKIFDARLSSITLLRLKDSGGAEAEGGDNDADGAADGGGLPGAHGMTGAKPAGESVK